MGTNDSAITGVYYISASTSEDKSGVSDLDVSIHTIINPVQEATPKRSLVTQNLYIKLLAMS